MSFSNMRALSVLIACFCSGTLWSQTTILTGSVHQDYIGKPAYLYVISDAVSGLKVLKDSATIGQDGMFRFKLNETAVVEANLSIDRVNATFFSAPGANYEVYFPQFPTDQARSFNNTNAVNLVFNNLPAKDINSQVSLFNRDFDNFFDQNVSNVFDQQFRGAMNKFREYCDSTYKKAGSAFLDEYINFAFANFDLSIGTSRKLITDQYLKYTGNTADPEFAAFVLKFFGDYIGKFETYSKNKPLTAANAKANVTEFLEQLKNDDALKSRTRLREVVVAVNLDQELNRKGANRSNLLKMLNDLAKQATDIQAKQLAQNFIKTSTQFEKGSPAYHFKLKDGAGDKISLESLKGKPAALIFAAGWSRESLNQLKLVNDLYVKFGKDINFVLVDLDDNEDDMEYLITGTQTQIPTKVSYSADKYMIEAMNILYVPQIVLIDRAGNYFRHNAKDPMHGLEAELTELIR